MQEIVRDTWKRLARASMDKKHPFRYMTLATINGNMPALRTIVLRKVIEDQRSILFFTHSQSAKVKQLDANPACSLLVYHPKQQIQIRLMASANVHLDEEQIASYWNTIPSYSKHEYLGLPPGSPIEAGSSTSMADRHAFCVVTCTVYHIDWLKLDRNGHQRYLFKWHGHQWEATQVRP